MKIPALLVFSDNIIEENNNESKLYRLICLAGFLYFFTIGFLRFIYLEPDLLTLISLSVSIGFGFIGLLFPFKHIKAISKAWPFYILSFIGFNSSFLLGGGFLNPSIYIIFPFVLIVIYLTNYKTTTIIILLMFINFIFLYIINYQFPEISTSTNTLFVKVERIISHFLTLLFTVVIINKIFEKYDEDKRKARESEKAKEAFLANMSHLIRTPLNGINGYGELLLDSDIPDFEKESFKNRIVSNAKELHHLIFNLIDLSIIQEKSLVLIEDRFLVNDLITSLKLKVKEEIARKNKQLEFNVKIDKTLQNLNLKLDGDRVMQLIWNFIENGINYSEKGAIQLSFKTDMDAEILIIIVEDSGIGMSQKLIENIQNQNILDRNQSNIANPKPGMGILISKGIIKYFGGFISISSEPKAGTHVLIELPIKNKYEIIE